MSIPEEKQGLRGTLKVTINGKAIDNCSGFIHECKDKKNDYHIDITIKKDKSKKNNNFRKQWKATYLREVGRLLKAIADFSLADNKDIKMETRLTQYTDLNDKNIHYLNYILCLFTDKIEDGFLGTILPSIITQSFDIQKILKGIHKIDELSYNNVNEAKEIVREITGIIEALNSWKNKEDLKKFQETEEEWKEKISGMFKDRSKVKEKTIEDLSVSFLDLRTLFYFKFKQYKDQYLDPIWELISQCVLYGVENKIIISALKDPTVNLEQLKAILDNKGVKNILHTMFKGKKVEVK